MESHGNGLRSGVCWLGASARRSSSLFCLLAVLMVPCRVHPAQKRTPRKKKDVFHAEVPVRRVTRLDWRFAVRIPGQLPRRLPLSYRSEEQRYQLFVPKSYHSRRAWPFIVFVSPGDDPMGWPFWEKVCREKQLFFCAAYGAGNGRSATWRARVILDVLDDARRRYRMDPNQTYLVGFSGGGTFACTLAFALPEYFGGVVGMSGASPIKTLPYLRHRVQERLSIALLTGSKDFRRDEIKNALFPLYRDLSIRSRLWDVPGQKHTIPTPEILGQVIDWLQADLKRRQKDAQRHPELSATPDTVLTDHERSLALLKKAQLDLALASTTKRGNAGVGRMPGTKTEREPLTYRAVCLLEGIVARWKRTEAAEKARKLLSEVRNDTSRNQRLREQESKEEVQVLAAQARAREALGQVGEARRLWQQLANDQKGTEMERKANKRVQALTQLLARTPYLGVRLLGASTTIGSVVDASPANRAGLRAGDRFIQFGPARVRSRKDLSQAMSKHKPGDSVKVQVQRTGRTLTYQVVVGAKP